MAEREAPPAGRRGRWVGIVLALLLAAILAGGLLRLCTAHRFTTRRWVEEPEARWNLVSSLLARYELVGMTRGEVLALLGGDSGPDGYGKTEHNLSYCLGLDQFFPIDDWWLILELEDGVVTGYRIAQS